ncbi:MAG TPA: hypothetical protein VNF68_05730, partial [Candidatus Baltobacteraceae bacterium]|nr:hypothetical protein [Candidatus Baltobacteraceae bacterium]
MPTSEDCVQDDRLDHQQDLGVAALPGQVNPPTYYANAQPQPTHEPQGAPSQPDAAPAAAQPSLQQ